MAISTSRTILRAGLLLTAVLCLPGSSAFAQISGHGRFYPLDQTVPPGIAALWSATIRAPECPALQHIQVHVPEGGLVSFFAAPGASMNPIPVPAQVAIHVGPVYRFKISNIPEYPGVELYPTVELVDHLHPPAGREAEFPVPLVLTDIEITSGLSGQLVTKIIYLEQPDLASTAPRPDPAPTEIVGRNQNAFAVADARGRPIAILRVGGRVPDPTAPEPGFYGICPPVLVPTAATLEAAGRSQASRALRNVAHEDGLTPIAVPQQRGNP